MLSQNSIQKFDLVVTPSAGYVSCYQITAIGCINFTIPTKSLPGFSIPPDSAPLGQRSINGIPTHGWNVTSYPPPFPPFKIYLADADLHVVEIQTLVNGQEGNTWSFDQTVIGPFNPAIYKKPEGC